MDNRQIDVTSEGLHDFELSLRLITGNKKAIGYQIVNNTLVLYWAQHEEMIPFPCPMNVDEMLQFLWAWLNKTKPITAKPDIDGDEGHGFRIYCEGWGHVNNLWQAYSGITPIWSLYGI